MGRLYQIPDMLILCPCLRRRIQIQIRTVVHNYTLVLFLVIQVYLVILVHRLGKMRNQHFRLHLWYWMIALSHLTMDCAILNFIFLTSELLLFFTKLNGFICWHNILSDWVCLLLIRDKQMHDCRIWSSFHRGTSRNTFTCFGNI